MLINFLNTTKEQRRELLNSSYEVRLEKSKECIKQVLSVAKKPIIQFSGGIDSCVMADIIHKIDDTVPVLFNDWGIFLPEQEKFCIDFFNKYNYKYYISRSEVNWQNFISKNGSPIFKGIKFIKEEDYKNFNITKKCRNLKKICWNKFYKEHKPDYYFVGIIHDESPQRKALFINYGFIIPKEKGILVKPIILLKKEEMFNYCKENNLIYPKEYYKDSYQNKEFEYKHCDLGCFMCGIRFKEYGYGRLGRLARNNNSLFKELMDLGLRKTLSSIVKKYPKESYYILNFLEEYDNYVISKITAYDLDGVLCPMPKREKKYNQQKKYEREMYDKLKREHFLNAQLLRIPKEKEWFIISGRREKYRIETEKWFKLNNLNPKEIHLMNGALTFENIIKFKINKLKDLKIERYYEDDPKIIREIKKQLPNIEIIQIQRTEENIKVINTKQFQNKQLFS